MATDKILEPRDGFKPPSITAIAILLDGGNLIRDLSPTQRVAAAYELADEVTDELKAAAGPDFGRNQARRLLIRALAVSLYADTDDGVDYLRDLIAELADEPSIGGDSTDWDQVGLSR